MLLQAHLINFEESWRIGEAQITGRKQMSLLSSRELEERLWELLWKVEENPAGEYFQTHKGLKVDQEQSAWICKGEIRLNQPQGLLQ